MDHFSALLCSLIYKVVTLFQSHIILQTLFVCMLFMPPPNIGCEVIRITASSRSAVTPCVWQLLVLPDGTIVSGDGEGAVQMWDANFGTLLHRSQKHKADVLALAAAPDGSAVFAAGVDSQVRI
jgi:WD40 repeat protein